MGGLLAESLEVLRRELPSAYDRMCARLAGEMIRIQVDEEEFIVEVDPRQAVVIAAGQAGAPPTASITASRRAIGEVIEARRTMAEAVLADEVEAVAPLDRLAVILSGLATYVHGAVRSPSFPGLLERFRRVCEGHAGTMAVGAGQERGAGS